MLAVSIISIGPMLIGFQRAQQGRQSIAQLQTLIVVLDKLERELGFGQAGLLAIFRKSEHLLLLNCADALAKPRPPSVSQLWEQGLRHHFPLLSEAAFETARQVGQVLGRYDAKRQCQAIEQAREALSLIERTAHEETQRSGRVSRTLGMAAGAFIFIILI